MLAGGKRFQHETQSCPDDRPTAKDTGLGSWKPGSLLAGSAQRSHYISFVLLRELPQAEAMSEDGHSPCAQHGHRWEKMPMNEWPPKGGLCRVYLSSVGNTEVTPTNWCTVSTGNEVCVFRGGPQCSNPLVSQGPNEEKPKGVSQVCSLRTRGWDKDWHVRDELGGTSGVNIWGREENRRVGEGKSGQKGKLNGCI